MPTRRYLPLLFAALFGACQKQSRTIRQAGSGQFGTYAAHTRRRRLHARAGAPYADVAMLKSARGAEATPVQAGEQELSVSVEVIFAIE